VSREQQWGTRTEPLKDNDNAVVSLLLVSEGPPRVVPLVRDVAVSIGRATNSNVVVEDTSLSRQHAQFCLRADGVDVEDLGSSNGTVVRGEKLVPGHRATLAIGESAKLGAVLVVVQKRSGTVAEQQMPAASAGPSDELVARIAGSAISVLILGETGVGKEVMAERIHALSPRHGRELVKINCAALMTSVLESELFGHERGAFTGAAREKPGLVESADGGTLFLDEIGEASLAVQVKLLRLLETRETQRIGALRPQIVDVRFVAATNRNPAEQIRAGTLRADLYHRIAGFTIMIPPLRERLAEIPALVDDLLARHADPMTVNRAALGRLMQHDWPGNVRQLRNVLDRARVLARGVEIGVAEIEQALQLEPGLADAPARPSSPVLPPDPAPADADPERTRILAVLAECGGNQTMAAEKLGMSRRALVHRMQLWGMTRPRRKRT
jgi:two-component system, NtrC family, response regulator AtoC